MQEPTADYEAIMAEVQGYLAKQLSNDEWLEETIEREEAAYQQALDMQMNAYD